MKLKTKATKPSGTDLVQKLIKLLKSDSSDKAAAEALLEMIRIDEVEASVAMRAYRSAVKQVYFP